MKIWSVIPAAIIAISTAAVATAHFTADRNAHAPKAALAVRSTDLLTASEHSFKAYLTAVQSHDVRAMNAVLTDDAVVEYPSDRLGKYEAVDNDVIADFEEVAMLAGRNLGFTNLRVFPTLNSNTVFVQYEAEATPSRAAASQTRLVMLKMRGDRIRLIRNFSAPRNF